MNETIEFDSEALLKAMRFAKGYFNGKALGHVVVAGLCWHIMRKNISMAINAREAAKTGARIEVLIKEVSDVIKNKELNNE